MSRLELRLDLCTYPPLYMYMVYSTQSQHHPLSPSTKDALELDPGSDSAISPVTARSYHTVNIMHILSSPKEQSTTGSEIGDYHLG